VDRNTIDIRIIDKPDNLVREEFSIILRGKVGFGGFRRVQLKTLSNTLSQYIQSGICLDDFVHRLPYEGFHSGEPVSIRAMNVVSKIDANKNAMGRWVDGHVIGSVIQELEV